MPVEMQPAKNRYFFCMLSVFCGHAPPHGRVLIDFWRARFGRRADDRLLFLGTWCQTVALQAEAFTRTAFRAIPAFENFCLDFARASS